MRNEREFVRPHYMEHSHFKSALEHYGVGVPGKVSMREIARSNEVSLTHSEYDMMTRMRINMYHVMSYFVREPQTLERIVNAVSEHIFSSHSDSDIKSHEQFIEDIWNAIELDHSKSNSCILDY